MRGHSRARLAQEKARDDRRGTARHPEHRTVLKVQVEVRRVSDAPTDVMRVDRAKESRDSKN